MSRTGHVPTYRLHKPSGQARVIIEGRQVYLGKFGSPESRERYARLLAETAVPGAQAPATPAGRPQPLVVELCAAYLVHAMAYYQKEGNPTSQVDIVRAALRALRALYGRTPAAEFGPLRLQAIQEALVQQGRTRYYVNKLVGQVRRVFKWGVAQELIPPSVFQGLQAVPGLKRGRTGARETEPVGPVPDDVVDATLPYLPSVVADMVRLQRLTGTRPGEVCLLRPGDIDRSGPVWEYRPASHKTQHHGRDRIVFIGPRAQEVLMPYLLRPAGTYCFNPRECVGKRTRKPRAKRRPGERYSDDAYRRCVARAVAKANEDRAREGLAPLAHWHPSQLRHSAATEIRRQFGLEAAQVILGHAKADVTQVYAERDLAAGRAVAEKIG